MLTNEQDNREWRYGYHYTTLSNWDQIKKDGGFIPYRIEKPELRDLTIVPINGIWLWTKRLTGMSHAGSIIFQSQKGDANVVLLKVKYYVDTRLRVDNRLVQLYHQGTIGNLKYHNGEEAIIVTTRIPFGDIQVVNIYNLMDRLS